MQMFASFGGLASSGAANSLSLVVYTVKTLLLLSPVVSLAGGLWSTICGEVTLPDPFSAGTLKAVPGTSQGWIFRSWCSSIWRGKLLYVLWLSSVSSCVCVCYITVY